MDTDVAIIGAGFGGIGAAIRLRQQGYHDFVLFEQADEVGGTWRDNTYPGCACDVPSHLYSFSFAPNPGWSETYSAQPEILAYLRDCVHRYGLAPQLRLGHALREARWDAPTARWQLTTSQGPATARVLVLASGPFSQPSIPDIDGLGSFRGTTFHSASWRHDEALAGRRIAVIGTGASAVQFVPRIQPDAASLVVFQRTPPWVLPRGSRAIPASRREAYRRHPTRQWLQRIALYWLREASGLGFQHPRLNRLAQRIALAHLHRQVTDPALRAALTPSYVMGCKRVLTSDDFYPALTRDNVTVVTSPIAEVRPSGVVTADGVEHAVDTIVFGTGFHVTEVPLAQHVVGRGGKRLSDAWSPTMRAHLGTTVAGFPNLFVILGPNTGLGHTSVVLMIESQLTHLLKALTYLRSHHLDAVEPTEQAQTSFVRTVDTKMAGTVWLRGGCQSWYLDATGRNSTLWPGFATAYRLRLRRFRPGEYRVVRPAAMVSPHT
jgi:cation diffusion facilitator CzcD-associated flavoprotein CzcO